MQIHIVPDLETFLNQAEKHKLLSVSCRLSADLVTPISLFQLFDDHESAFLLESVLGGEHWARYSIMGRSRLMSFTLNQSKIRIAVGDQVKSFVSKDPLKELQKLLDTYTMPRQDTHLPYRCALTGYFAYDFIRYVEKLPDQNQDELMLPDCALMAPQQVVLFDHLKNEATVLINVIVSDDIKETYEKAVDDLNNLAHLLFTRLEYQPEKKLSQVNNKTHPVFKTSAAEQQMAETTEYDQQDKSEYISQVLKAKEYIYAGDIFQVVLSRRYRMDCHDEPFSIYRALRAVNPSPYLFFLRCEDAVLTGASPEMLVRKQGTRVETCPIAGTRRRGHDSAADEKLASELLADEKEAAEHAMLVDLSRNDLGRISQFGSVKVSKYRSVEKYSHVMHLVSLVEGELANDIGTVKVLASVLPAGTLSGAPKIRAMEIIDELEKTRRGPYGGAVGYLGFDGQMDTCITIRTAVIKNQSIYVQAGAGIVADSVPESEYDEVRQKAKALLSAVRKAGQYQ